MTDINKTLEERGETYGGFAENSETSQKLKNVIYAHNCYSYLNYSQREALDAICQKIARIMNGDANYTDNWHDIAGYATLAERACDDKK